MTGTVLDRILAHKRDEVARRRRATPLPALIDHVRSAPPARGFSKAILARIQAGDPAVIAEVKKASPSKGVIRENFDPVAIAQSYAAAGAACLSVLTDEIFFQGNDRYLVDARSATRIPILRKDFVVDTYQIFEARQLGADCILLIVAALEPELLNECHACAVEQGLDVLIEVHDKSELDTALKLSPTLIGINNRDLRTFDTNLSTTYDLLPEIPNDVIVVTESGIHDRSQVAELRAHDVNAFLVGEAFMRDSDPGAALRRLFFE